MNPMPSRRAALDWSSSEKLVRARRAWRLSGMPGVERNWWRSWRESLKVVMISGRGVLAARADWIWAWREGPSELRVEIQEAERTLREPQPERGLWLRAH